MSKDTDTATISYAPEAYDTAAHHFRQAIDYTVTVVPIEGEPFDARLESIECDDITGEYIAAFWPWSEELGNVDPEQAVVRFNIYTQLDHMEVL